MNAQGGGRYQLRTRIATGGMGEVWRSEDTLLDREVAVKVLKHEYADDPAFRSRFEAEARHAAALHHPNVASVFDVGELVEDDGSGTRRPFLVMELVPGQPLSALLRSGEPMPADRAADVVAQASDAIAAAHAIGIVHRDVKPANLLVTPDGTVKITDFGIARAMDAAAITQTGQIIGTPHYISPEQAEGHPATEASDVYALGVVLYECLAGRRPFTRDTPIQVALAHIREPVPPLADDVPARLRAIVERALAKDPEDRFASAADLALALRGGTVAGIPGATAAAAAATPPPTQVLEDPFPTAVAAPAAATTASTPSTRAGDGRRLPAWWPWVAAAAAVLAVVLATSALAGGGDPEPAASAGDAASETDDRVRVRAADHVGRDADDVRADLEGLGLEVTEEQVAATSADQAEGTVAAVRPRGLLDPGTVVRLDVYDEYVEYVEPPADDGDDDETSTENKSTSPGKSKGKGNAKGKKD